MAKVRVPGVHFVPSGGSSTSQSISLGETGIPAFLGVAERGPLNTPIRVPNFERFKTLYGAPVRGSYLSSCVEGFFLNGGRFCYVVRVAHVFPVPGDESELAKRAQVKVENRAGLPALQFVASSEGSWGNNLTLGVQVPERARVQTVATEDIDADSERASLSNSRGLEAGMIVRLWDGDVERFVTLSQVRGNTIFWQGSTGHAFRATAPTFIESVEFNVTISTRELTERFTQLSQSETAARNYLRIINSESQLVQVRDLAPGTPLPDGMPNTMSQQLRGGSDGLNGLTPQDFIGKNEGPGERYGLGALEEEDEDVDLIVAPDLHFALEYSGGGFKHERDILRVHRAMIDHCELMGDRFALLDLPQHTTIEGALNWRIGFDTAHAALYFPWLVVVDKGKKRSLPPTGHIAGLISRLDAEEGVYRAPANLPLDGVVDTSVVVREEHVAELTDKGINCVRFFPVRGIRPWGARTMSSDPRWAYINIRRIFNAVRRAILRGTQWAVFEPNNTALRAKLSSMVEDFLRALWSSGYFKGDTQNQAFFVVCNRANNDQDTMEDGKVIVDVGIAPVYPTEFMDLHLEYTVEDRRLGDMTDIDEAS